MRISTVLVALVIVGFAGGWWYVRQHPEVLPAPIQALTRLKKPELPKPLQEGPAAEQMEVFSERAQGVAVETQKVLGDAIQVNEAESVKSIPQKAVDHSLYLYCQSFVKSYEESLSQQ